MSDGGSEADFAEDLFYLEWDGGGDDAVSEGGGGGGGEGGREGGRVGGTWVTVAI